MKQFNLLTRYLILLITTLLIVFLTGVNSGKAQAKLTERSQLAINGIGPIRIGMTIDEASQSAGVKLVQTSSGGEDYGCFYYKPQGKPEKISFMVIKNRIVRVDIDNERITTIKGAKIGDTEARIFSLYPGQIQATPHPYVGGPPRNGKYLTFIPKDITDKNYRMIFETSRNRVMRFRSGKLPEVEYIEGCL